MPKKETASTSKNETKKTTAKTSTTSTKKTTSAPVKREPEKMTSKTPVKSETKPSAKSSTKSAPKTSGGTLKKVDAVAEMAVDKRGKMQQQDKQTYSNTTEQDASSIKIGKIRVGFVTIENVEIGKAKQKTKNYKP
ncbi:MAG TPA: hypothetical protein DCO72_09910 [Ruminococcus sp.]|nr:hypothetical protein [Ruminococcus sp.]